MKSNSASEKLCIKSPLKFPSQSLSIKFSNCFLLMNKERRTCALTLKNPLTSSTNSLINLSTQADIYFYLLLLI